jgi:flagellar basal body-associated protein FliL
MEENASTLSLGQFVISAYVGEEKQASMGIDIWVRVSQVEAANYVQSHEIVLRDKTMDALNELYMQKVNLLTEQGKEFGKKKIRDFLNRTIPEGKVEEVFFHNIIVQ